jgi:hypothetical protein
MILSTSKLKELLETFKMSSNILPYNKSKEKQEMQNAKNFINNYHMYGTPFNGINSTNIIYLNNNKINKDKLSSSDEQSNNSEYSYKRKKTIKPQNYTNVEDIERATSLKNLRQTQKIYQQQKILPKMKSATNIFSKNYLYNNPYLPLQSTNTIYLNNQSLYMPNKYNFSRDNKNMDLNPINNYTSKNKMFKSLSDIPSNPEDVVIKNLPANFSQVINPVSSNIIASFIVVSA